MQEKPELPLEFDGFTNTLLWMVTTRATALVDRLFAAGLAQNSPRGPG